MTQSSKNWCFTLNNYSDEDEQRIQGLTSTYLVYGREIGESLTPHLQGFIVIPTKSRLSALKKLHATAHWEIAKGNAAQNRTYCTKDGNIFESGELPMSPKEKGDMEIARYDAARAAAIAGNFDDIPSDIYVRHLNALHKIYALKQVAPTALAGSLQNEWIYGPAGTGKSTKAFAENPGSYLKGLTKWWDGYTHQTSVIIDDMDPYHKSLAQEFKQWAHHHPFPAETKGGTMCIRPQKIIVTSNYRIDEIWEDQTTRDAIHRRFKEVYMPETYIYDPYHVINKTEI